MAVCNLCPRECNIDRSGDKRGYCGEGDTLRVARIAPHHFEEPVISGTRGSGAVFFSGCSLGCVFCQNKDISRRGGSGREMSSKDLRDAILDLQESGVHNINLVTPTHFVHKLVPILMDMRSHNELSIPVVYNTSGYEKVETLKDLDGLVDIYMPDLKYFSAELAKKYSAASNYPDVALRAIKEMLSQVGSYEFSASEPSVLKRGLIVRHLVLPSHRADSIAVLEELAKAIPAEDILLSLMSQYTPDFALDTPYRELHRRITSFEYSSVVKRAEELGFEGFIQEKSSAVSDFTPDFNNK